MTNAAPSDRRRFLAFAAAGLALPTAAFAAPGALSADDSALVQKAVDYLESLHEVRARFSQSDGRGAMTQGTVFLKRPGKARFEYDPPSGLLVVSNGSVVSIADGRLKTFDSYPLGTTPLSLFLAKTIRLDRGVQVTKVDRMADGFTVTARDGAKPAAGQIALTFSERPMSLVSWVVTDAQNRSVRVTLSGLAPASGLSPNLFELKDPRPKNVGRGKS